MLTANFKLASADNCFAPHFFQIASNRPMPSVMDSLTQRLNPRLVISISIALIMLVPLAFLVQIIYASAFGQRRGEVPVDAGSTGQIVPALDIPPVSKYQEAVQAYHLFRPPVEPVQQVVKAVGIADLAKNLELTGVIELDKREAIIKDRRSQQSYFVNEGSVIGELVVQKIESDKVTLQYKDETHELHIV